MLLSKTFAYALRSMLYLSLVYDENKPIQVSEIANSLNIPKHFLAKVLQQFSKKGILESVKGPNGGFRLNEKSMQTSLIEIFAITDGTEMFEQCALRFNKCDHANPCPLHYKVSAIRQNLISILTDATIADLMNDNKPLRMKNITSYFGVKS